MITVPSISPTTRRSLLIVETSVLLVSTWFNLNDPEIRKSLPNIINIILSIIAIAPLIAFLPVSRPLWQRRVYFLISIIIFATAYHQRVPIYTLNLVFLLKGCLLLSRRETIAIAAISLLLDITSFSIRAPEIFESIRNRDIDAYLNVPRIITNIAMGDLSNCVFVLLLGNVWVEEQKSRQKAERLTQQVETLATDLERNRIARDIHDTLGHSLTSLDVQIELAQRLQATEPERAQQSIDLAKQLSSQAIDNVRQALGTMKQSNFDLKEAIVALAEQNQPFQIVVNLQFPQLSLQSSYQLYCIVQESLTNIQKHAQAERVTIDSKIVNNGTVLQICDNGKGFSLARPHPGFGLRNMKERVQCLGGEFYLTSNEEQGTQIKIFIPFR
ncbi:sensor histidine kinase [Chamaesiphon sp. GL140_3_metabinner_50]|uniref:sensor histidine kinase n=1 Tax=Chamaesiphon sp. GL140_3_metabinner_50 TaxID=2970812 RepID=UPI0025FB358C|nr:sensor histidine kinase [Chamaesiphon sp. GL140_3_metabinner_50]